MIPALFMSFDLVINNHSVGSIIKQAKRLKSHKIRPEVNRLDGQWACWSIGLMVDRLDG